MFEKEGLKKRKYIIITGSVISGLGKGVFSSSLANLLKHRGFNVELLKFDGYLNVDAGTLNPYRHGEVFVLDDGTETDLDLGTYERALNKSLDKDNYLTSGKIFKMIIDKERKGDFLGEDVQFIPHVTDTIKELVKNLAEKKSLDITMIEIGGTVGDLENSYFVEAMRELQYELGKENVIFVNVTYIVKLGTGEHKSKAAQLGIRSLMSLGIQPSFIVCRSEDEISDDIKKKISIASNVSIENIISLYDVKSIYEVPSFLRERGVDYKILNLLGLKERTDTFYEWKNFLEKLKSASKEIKVAITGKYTELADSYISILKALEHCAPYYDCKVNVKWVDTTELENLDELRDVDGIIIPGGFGKRGVEGKIKVAGYARENNVPFLGLCLGFQSAVIDFARSVCQINNAGSTEFQQDCQPVIDILPEQRNIPGLGGTMRLGGHDVNIKLGSKAEQIYKNNKIKARFRHRYNVNPKYVSQLEEKGMIFSGYDNNRILMEILELPHHPFFIGVQYHPCYTSRPLQPDPLFSAFIKACLDKKEVK